MTSEIKQTKAWAGSGVAVLINKALSTASPEEKHSSWFNKTGYNKRFIWNILDLFIEDIFFFLPAPGPSAAAAAYHRCLCAGAGGLRSCSRSIDCRHITGRQMCVAFLPPAPPKSSIQVVLTKKTHQKKSPQKTKTKQKNTKTTKKKSNKTK